MANTQFLPFPQSSDEMETYQQKYKFDTGAGKWYNPGTSVTEPVINSAGNVVGSGAIGTPINASQVNDGGDVVLPAVTGSPTSIDNSKAATGGMQVFFDQMQKQVQEQQKQLQTQQADQAKWWDKISKKTAPTAKESLKQFQDIQAQLNPTRAADLKEIQSLQESYDTLSAAKDQMLLNAENLVAPMNIIEGKQAQINKQMNLELNAKANQINTKTAFLQLQDQQVDKAVTFMNNAITNHLAEQRVELQAFGQFYDINQDLLTSIDTKYQDMFNLAYQESKERMAESTKNAEYVRDLIVRYPEAAWPKDSTTLWSLTSDQASQIAGNRPTKIAKADEPISILDVERYNDLFPDAGVTVGDTETEANAKVQESQRVPAIEAAIQQHKDSGKSKGEVELQWHKDTGAPPSPEVQAIIDEVFKLSFWDRFWFGRK